MNYDDMYYWMTKGIWLWLSDRPRKLISFWQRGLRGWSDEDTWAFDAYLAKVIYEGCSHLKIYQHGCPPVKGKTVEEQIEIWDRDLNKIISAFHLLYQIQWSGEREWRIPKMDPKTRLNLKCITLKEEKMIKEGMQVFVKNFNNLWD